VNRVGVKPALVFGMALMTVGLVYFTQVSVGGSYWADLFPGFLIIGLGIPFAFIPITIAALAGTKPQEAGLASGLINTTQQIGGALGIAVLASVANTTTTGDLKDGVATASALTHGFQNAFWVGVGVAVVGVVVALVFVRRSDLVPDAAVETTVDTA
jgi:MFS family permease